jgi:hypothetical protein
MPAQFSINISSAATAAIPAKPQRMAGDGKKKLFKEFFYCRPLNGGT